MIAEKLKTSFKSQSILILLYIVPLAASMRRKMAGGTSRGRSVAMILPRIVKIFFAAAEFLRPFNEILLKLL
jgi:hypothetical protein